MTIDWSSYDIHHPAGPKATPRHVLRPHQAQALDAVSKGFAESDRGKMIMACGTGKIFTVNRPGCSSGTRSPSRLSANLGIRTSESMKLNRGVVPTFATVPTRIATRSDMRRLFSAPRVVPQPECRCYFRSERRQRRLDSDIERWRP